MENRVDELSNVPARLEELADFVPFTANRQRVERIYIP